MQQILMISIKQLYGITCILGIAFLLLLMLYDVQPIRDTLKRIPSWYSVGKNLRKELKK